MAVAIYRVGALQYFEKTPKDKFKDIAFESLMLGRSGISSKKKSYKLNKLPGKSFSGYQLLTIYYVTDARNVQRSSNAI